MTPTDKLRAAVDRYCDVAYTGTPDVIRAFMGDLQTELAKIDRELKEARQTCPDCGSPMPGVMCCVCALAHAERLLVELRKDKERLDRIDARAHAERELSDDVIWRLRATLTSERVACGHPAYSETTLSYERPTNAAIAAVEQELGAKDAEIAELGKRPPLHRVTEELAQHYVDIHGGAWLTSPLVVADNICKLYGVDAEKARAEVPK